MKVLCACFLGFFFELSAGRGFLAEDHASLTSVFTTDLQTAMDEVMGCGGKTMTKERSEQIERVLLPMWRTMPSKEDDRLDWKSLRYVAHRYFMQQSSLLIRGFEPSAAMNQSTSGAAEILAKQVPDHVDSMLGGHHASRGYSISDGVALIAAVEQLVFDSETALLEHVYKQQKTKVTAALNRWHLRRVLESYMVHWMLGEDQESIQILMSNRTLLEHGFPHWQDLKRFIDGRIRTMDYLRSNDPKSGDGAGLLNGRYSFDDAHEVVGGITRTFQTYWESECKGMKNQLVGMDKTGTGRVKLSDFYGTGMDADWRFGESESYLRDLGVLDESSPWIGKQVVIPNYLQAASNCIVSTPHYLVCCANECEELLQEIEDEIRAPYADPEALLKFVGNMTSPSSDEDEPPQLEGTLTEQLMRIADSHGGQVPLHGRLFAQWLHYVFPRECPFPHKSGSFATHTLTPGAFGDEYIATRDEMEKHANTTIAESEENSVDPQWMSQWSLEEELFAEYKDMQAPWEKSKSIWWYFAVATLMLLGVGAATARGVGCAATCCVPTTATKAFVDYKSHMV